MNVGELIDKWMEGINAPIRTSTFNYYKRINEAHLKPYFGKMLVVAITEQAYVHPDGENTEVIKELLNGLISINSI